MVSSVKFTLVLIILATASCTSYALKCYKCNSNENLGCNKKLEGNASAWIVDCAENDNGCGKIGNKVEVLRFCSNGALEIACAMFSNMFSPIYCDVCTTDLCNGNSSAAPITAVNGLSSSSSTAPNTAANGVSSSSSIGPIVVTILLFFSLACFLV